MRRREAERSTFLCEGRAFFGYSACICIRRGCEIDDFVIISSRKRDKGKYYDVEKQVKHWRIVMKSVFLQWALRFELNILCILWEYAIAPLFILRFS